jgi:hypothetical protein
LRSLFENRKNSSLCSTKTKNDLNYSALMNPSHQPVSGHIVQITRCDRWTAYQRLQDLSIICNHPADGSLRVDVANFTEILQVRSVIQQLTAPRQTLINWLDRCWSTR